jgi:polyhydroxyalkanoate synthesis regulator phasin
LINLVQGEEGERRRLREEVERLQRRVEQLEQERGAGRGKSSY